MVRYVNYILNLSPLHTVNYEVLISLDILNGRQSSTV